MSHSSRRLAAWLLMPLIGTLTALLPAAPSHAAATCTAAYQVTSAWPSSSSGSAGFAALVVVTNPGPGSTTAWKVTLTFADGITMYNYFTAQKLVDAPPTFVFGNLPFNGAIPVGSTARFGLIAMKSSDAVSPNPVSISCSAT